MLSSSPTARKNDAASSSCEAVFALKEIHGLTFYGLPKLERVNIPSSVETIGVGAFSRCESLDILFIPKTVTTITNQSFSYCDGLTVYSDAERKPNGWSESSGITYTAVNWGCTEQEWNEIISNK